MSARTEPRRQLRHEEHDAHVLAVTAFPPLNQEELGMGEILQSIDEQ
jgi:hypothetical protein